MREGARRGSENVGEATRDGDSPVTGLRDPALEAGGAALGERSARGRPSRVAALGVVAASVFAALAVSVTTSGSAPGDARAFNFLERYEDTPVMAQLVTVLSTDVVAYLGLVAAVVAAGAFAFRRQTGAAAFVLLVVAGAATTPLLKRLFERTGPPEDGVPSHLFSFPSGHAMGSMALASAFVALAWPLSSRRALVLALGASAPLATGLAVIADGVHWPSDVVAGWSLALAWTCVAWLLTRRILDAPALVTPAGQGASERPPGGTSAVEASGARSPSR